MSSSPVPTVAWWPGQGRSREGVPARPPAEPALNRPCRWLGGEGGFQAQTPWAQMCRAL